MAHAPHGAWAITAPVGNSNGNTVFFENTAPASILFVSPVSGCGGNAPCYPLPQQALDASLPGASIDLAVAFYDQDVMFAFAPGDQVTMAGGWDATFSARGVPAIAIATSTLPGRTTLRSLLITGGTLRID